VTVDDTDSSPLFSSPDPSEVGFEQLGARLRELEEWGWVSSDPAVDSEDRMTLFARVFPGDDTSGPWNDYHWVRSEYDRRAAEEFDLGQ
jgi:hypothetical protein